MGNPNGPHRGGVDPVRVALRSALNVYVWQHLRAHPNRWFSAVELARVISTQYICERRPPSLSGTERWGRSNVIGKILESMLDAGEVEVSARTGSPAPVASEWRWAGDA